MRQIDDKLIEAVSSTYKQSKYIKNPTCYFYDLDAILKNIDNLQNSLPSQIRLYYAMKANNNAKVMECVCNHKYTTGIEIASYGEMEQALKYKNSNNIIFTGPGKTDYEVEQAILKKIQFINVESVLEAIRIDRIARLKNVDHVDILLRINLNYCITDATEHMSGYSTKMGIDEEECIEAIRYIKSLDRVRIKGIHVFAASGVLNYEGLLKSNKYIFDLVLKLEKEIGKISIIDLGGGLGIDYTDSGFVFDIDSYGRELSNLIDEYKFNNKKIFMELGTYIVGNAGYYTAKIIDIKRVKGRKHIIIAGGVNHMGLPLEMRRKHPIAIVPMYEKKLYDNQPRVCKELVDISGPLCMVSDKLSWDEYVEEAMVGDVVVFLQAGAYCYGEGMHAFLSHFYPDEIII